MVPNSKQSCGLVRKKKKKQPSSASVQTEVFPPILVDHAAKTQLVVDQEDSHLELHTGQVRLGQVRYLPDLSRFTTSPQQQQQTDIESWTLVKTSPALPLSNLSTYLV